jgi:1A family penicillin-binding protein
MRSLLASRWGQLLRSGWRWLTRLTLLTLVVLGLLLSYLWLSTPLPTPERLHAQAANGNTRILDRSGKLLYNVPDPLSGRQHVVELATIPETLKQATIAIEDASFYTNPGVDWRGVLRATWLNLRHGEVVAGGSTLTQQVARNVLLEPQFARQQSLERKLREMVLALKMTTSLSKDEILALYLNQVYYGGWSYGVEAAARHYFGKSVGELDLAESALLAGLPQAPSTYDPRANPEVALARQSQVLDAMVRTGFIRQSEAEQAKNERLQLATTTTTTLAEQRAPHAVQYVLALLTAELGADAVLRGGLTVTTTLDVDLNDAAQRTLTRQIANLNTPRPGEPEHRARNGAVVVLDPANGAILALVGSPNFADTAHDGQVNAALARRQPGSAIKPLTYAAALERNWTPASLLFDVPTSFPSREGNPYTPNNYDRNFYGPLTFREALATSSNVAAVSLLDQVGIQALLDIADRMGIRSLGHDSGRYGLSLTLGGGEVTPLELTAAYAAFANGGQRVEPFIIKAVADRSGPLSVRVATQRPTTTAVAPQVAYLISDILADRFARMRAFGSNSPLEVDRPAAVKTGTTTDWRDNWAVGYTPDRAVGVWIGNADGRPMQHVSGLSGAGPVWHEVMLVAHRSLPARNFVRPPGIVEAAICAPSGLLPSPTCPHVRQERFVAGSVPTRADDTHIAVAVDRVFGCRAPSGYPADRVTTRIVRRLPPEAQAWAVEHGVPRMPETVCPMPITASGSQPLLPESGAPPIPEVPVLPPQAGVSALLMAPGTGATFRLSPGVPAERQQLVLVAAAADDASSVTIMLNDQALATFAHPPYRAFWQLTPGQHRAWVEVLASDGTLKRSKVVEFTVLQ